MRKTLIIGYGNPDRQDDGVAWHVLTRLARRLSPDKESSIPTEPEAGFETDGENPDYLFTLQLTPELSERITQYIRVCFIDAHTGSEPNNLNLQLIQPIFQNSPFTHHLTPESLLSFTQTIYGSAPEAILISIRGYSFGFERALSPSTELLANQAVDYLSEWLETSEKPA